VILNLSIPDTVYVKYSEYGFHRPHQAIEAQVKRFQDVDPSDARAIVLTGKVRGELEKVSGRTIDSPEELVKVMRKMSELKIGDEVVELPEELQNYYRGQAEFHGRSAGEWIRTEVARLMFANAGRGTY
jgi:hypothetical protein